MLIRFFAKLLVVVVVRVPKETHLLAVVEEEVALVT